MAAQRVAIDAEATRGFEEDVGRWLSARDLLRRDRRLEERRELRRPRELRR